MGVVQDVLYRETAVRVDWDGLCKSLARSNRDAVSVFTDVDTVVIDPSAETREDYVGAISRLPQRVDASPLISVLYCLFEERSQAPFSFSLFSFFSSSFLFLSLFL